MFDNLKQKAQTAATVASLAGASFGMAEKADAALMLPGQSAQSYLDLGATMQNKVGFLKQIGTQGQLGYASVTFINEQYAITSAHLIAGVLQVGGSFQVGTGSNYLTDPGNVVNVSSVLVHPAYQGNMGSADTNNPDIAILRFASPLAGITQATFGAAAPFDIVTSGGYGFAFYAGEPSVPRDGFRRGWNAPVKTGAPLYGSDTWYNYTQFGGASGSSVPVNGKVLSGDSGGGVYNSLGELVGINFGQSGNSAILGTSSYLDLSQPDVLNWVQSNTTIPAPGALPLIGAAAMFGFGRRRRS